MKLRRGQATDPQPAPGGAPGGESTSDDASLDAIAAIVRVLGETALRTPDAAERLDAWARHILVLTEAPGQIGPAAPSAGRDWVGLRRSVVAHVKDESAAVSRTVDELQDAMWLVIDGLSQAMAGDEAADVDAAGQLERLRAAAAGSPEDLKATALQTVQRLSEIIDERHSRQHELARDLGQRVEALRVELDDTRREADLDPLTRVASRSVFQRELPRAIQVRTLVDEPACLAMVDLDHFKQINDMHGHQTGDAALEAFAGALVRSFPRRRDIVARYGGDEFAVIMRDASAADGHRLAERFLVAVRELEVAGERGPVPLTASVGVAEAFPGEPSESWFARADRALYEAKAAGRNRVAISVEDVHRRAEPESSRTAA